MATVRSAVEDVPRGGARRTSRSASCRSRTPRASTSSRRRTARPVQSAVDGLRPSGETALYAGVQDAVQRRSAPRASAASSCSATAATPWRRSQGGAAPSAVAAQGCPAALSKAKVRAEVVAFKSPRGNSTVLQQFAKAGGGSVVARRRPRGRGEGLRRRGAGAGVAGRASTSTRPPGLTGVQELVVTGTAERPAVRAPGRTSTSGRGTAARASADAATVGGRPRRGARSRRRQSAGRRRRFLPARADRPVPRRSSSSSCDPLRPVFRSTRKERVSADRPVRRSAALRPRRSAAGIPERASASSWSQMGDRVMEGRESTDQDDGAPRPGRPAVAGGRVVRPADRRGHRRRPLVRLPAPRGRSWIRRRSSLGLSLGLFLPPCSCATSPGAGPGRSSPSFPTCSCSSRPASRAGSACSRRSTPWPRTPPSRRPRSSPGRWPRPASAPTSPTPSSTWPSGWTARTCAGRRWRSASSVRSVATSPRPCARRPRRCVSARGCAGTCGRCRRRAGSRPTSSSPCRSSCFFWTDAASTTSTSACCGPRCSGILMCIAGIVAMVIGIFWMRKVVTDRGVTMALLASASSCSSWRVVVVVLATSSGRADHRCGALARAHRPPADARARSPRTSSALAGPAARPLPRTAPRAWRCGSPRPARATGSRGPLDKAGNPPAWTVERIMGAKGIGLVFGVVLGALLFGFDLRRAPRRRWRSRAFGFFLPGPPRLQRRAASARRRCGEGWPTPSTCSRSASRPARASTPRSSRSPAP